MAISDRVVIVDGGRTRQVGTPREIYEKPESRFVANFMGKANFVPATLDGREQAAARVRMRGKPLLLPQPGGVPLPAGAEVLLVVRPEAIRLLRGEGMLAGRIERTTYLDDVVNYEVQSNGLSLLIENHNPQAQVFLRRARLWGSISTSHRSAMYDLVCVGNYTKDTIVTPSGIRVVPGGAFNFSAHAGRALGLRTAAVTHLAREDTAVVRELEAIGVDVRVVYTPASTSLRLDYPSDNPDERSLSVTAQAGSFAVQEVEGIDAKAAVLGPSFHGEIGPEVIRALARPGRFLAIDVQGYIRRVVAGRLIYAAWEERREILPLVTILKTDAVESLFLTGEPDMHKAARMLHEEGPQEVLLTHRDGVLVFDGKEEYEASFCPVALVGRSGRGDTCLGSYVSRRLVDPPGEAILWAAALTSKKLEEDGPYKGDYAAVARLVEERYRGTDQTTV